MMRRRYDGVINYAKHRITNGAVEGVNNMIKTMRRASYAFRNNEYFFRKIIESTMNNMDYKVKTHRKVSRPKFEEKQEIKLRKTELSKIQNYNKRQKVVEQVRSLREEDYNYSQIGKILKVDLRTVKKYINPIYK